MPITTSPERIEEIRRELPEFPAARRLRYRTEFGLSSYDASVIVNQGANLARYFEVVAGRCRDAKQAANWVTQDVQRELNERKLAISEFPLTADILGSLLNRIVNGELTVKGAREVFAQLLLDDGDGRPVTLDRIEEIIEDKGLQVVHDTGLLDAAIATALADSQKAIDDYKSGKPQALGAVVGKIMKLVKGADAKVVRERLIQKLSEM